MKSLVKIYLSQALRRHPKKEKETNQTKYIWYAKRGCKVKYIWLKPKGGKKEKEGK